MQFCRIVGGACPHWGQAPFVMKNINGVYWGVVAMGTGTFHRIFTECSQCPGPNGVRHQVGTGTNDRLYMDEIRCKILIGNFTSSQSSGLTRNREGRQKR